MPLMTTNQLNTSIESNSIPKAEKEVYSFKKEQESAEARIKRQKHEFFTLLMVQLKNQDPTQPMDTNQVTQQLFAINQVEQQLETNKNLNDIKALYTSTQMNSGINYIDKTVSYAGNDVEVINGKGEFKYDILQDIKKIDQNIKGAKIRIMDSKGTPVHLETIDPKPGLSTYNWDNMGQQPDGMYKFEITFVDRDEKFIQIDNLKEFVETFSIGRVKSVLIEGSKTMLELKNKNIEIPDILRVAEPYRIEPVEQPGGKKSKLQQMIEEAMEAMKGTEA